MKKIISFILLLSLVFVLISCAPNQETSQQLDILPTALNVMTILKDKNMKLLSGYVHPSKGLRFTPYSYVNMDDDLVFAAEEIIDLIEDQEVKTWGQYDGSGEPINLSFKDYYKNFIYDVDFINSDIIGNNTPISQGNTTNNIKEAYPKGQAIEFHFTGFDPQYEGIDWASLTLVFETLDGTHYLVGVVHGQWTV